MPSFTNPMAGRVKRLRRDDGSVYQVSDKGWDNRRDVGEFVQSRRLSRGMTQKQLGKLLGMTGVSVSHIECGRNSLSPERYVDMADALGMGRQEFGRYILRHTNPWLFSLLWPKELPWSALEDIPERIRDHRIDEAGYEVGDDDSESGTDAVEQGRQGSSKRLR
jgi:transcriptional regulator with XRE-family HTH domain